MTDEFMAAIKKMKVEVMPDGLCVVRRNPLRMKRFKRPDLLRNFVYCGNYNCPGFGMCMGEEDKALSMQEIGRGYCKWFYEGGDAERVPCLMMREDRERDLAFLDEFDRQVFGG